MISSASERCPFLLIQWVDFWLTFHHIFYHSLLSFSCVSDALILAQYFDRYICWSCTLEQILVYPIVLQYFVMIKTLEELYKTFLVPTTFTIVLTWYHKLFTSTLFQPWLKKKRQQLFLWRKTRCRNLEARERLYILSFYGHVFSSVGNACMA